MIDKKISYYLIPMIKNLSYGREVVFFGKNEEYRTELEKNGIKVEKIFTGNNNLLADTSNQCIFKNELNGKKSEYYVILPFYLGDGTSQRNDLKKYGYEEFTDYIFINKTDDTNVTENAALNREILSAVSKIEKHLNDLETSIKTDNAKIYQVLWQCYREKGESDLDARKRFFRSIPQAKGTNRALQLAAIILMNKFHKVCSENNIKYWLDFGCLLGAVRHEGFIPWDDDIDVCMPRAEVEKFKEAMKDDQNFFVDDRFFMTPNGIHHVVQLKFIEAKSMKATYCLDIFIFDYTTLDNSMNTWNLYNDIKRRMVNESLSIIDNRSQDTYRNVYLKFKTEFDRILCISEQPTDTLIWSIDNFTYWQSENGTLRTSDVFPLVEVDFEGYKYFAPHDAEQFISKKYKDIYDMPDDMFTHQHFSRNDQQIESLKLVLNKHGFKYPD